MRIFLLIFLMSFIYGCKSGRQLPNYNDADVNVDADDPEPDPVPETLSGIYEVNFHEVENNCSSDDYGDYIDIQMWMTVVTQNKNEDGGFSVNIYLSELAWYMVNIAPDGTFDHTEELSEEASSNIAGALTPEYVSAFIALNLSDTETNFQCDIIYEIEGSLLFERTKDKEEHSEDEENNSISGIYETQVIQTLNSCDSSAPWRVVTWTNVMTGENFEDGSSLVNIFLDLWIARITIGNLLVAVDGTIDFSTLSVILTGELAPDRLDFSVKLFMATSAFPCSIFFDVRGYPIIERA